MAAGRKTKYSKTLVKKICELLATGDWSVKDTCKQVGLSESQFYYWKNTKPEFAEALSAAEDCRREVFKDMAKSGLAKLLDIHEYEEVQTEYENDKTGKPVIKSQKRIKKKIMPSTTAVIFALTNREPEWWKNRQSIDAKGDFNHNIGFSDFLMNAATTNDDEEQEGGGDEVQE
ncbi:transposase [Parapedobacter soli]|uniref:transposase n=1 Tax=Parapedobacter soli TaxID=416955 RepID=UPI0021C609E2|nr:transposase [Parapedobacter soli]